MAIKLDDELVALRDAAKALPLRRGGKVAHPITLTRWATQGLRGIKLEVLRVGGRLYTTQEALQQFFEKLTRSDRKLNDPGPSRPKGRMS